MRQTTTLFWAGLVILGLTAACSHTTEVRTRQAAHSVGDDARHDVRAAGHSIDRAADHVAGHDDDDQRNPPTR